MALLKFKRSAVPGKVPTLADLSLGELAINTFDGKVYIRKDSGTASIVEVGGGSGVLSFNSRTGAVTLTSGDVTGALGYTPANRAGDTFTGNVGIGHSPSFALDINGNARSVIGNSYFCYTSDYGMGTPNSNGLQIFTSNGDTIRFGHRTGGTTFTERMLLDTGGSVTAWVDLRAPIFYDSQNTAYYVDPASTSSLNIVRSGIIQFASTGNTAINLTSSTYNLLYDPNGRNALYLGGAGDPGNYYDNDGHYFRNRAASIMSYITGSGMFAPAFYDSNNTGNYLDPAGTSQLVTVQTSGGSGFRSFATPSASITSQLYFANTDNTRAWNWQLDENNNAALWSYNGSAWQKRFTVNQNGSAVAAASINIGGGGTYQPGSIYSDGNWGMIFRAFQASPNQADFLWTNSADSERLRISTAGSLISPFDMRAPIFYDSNNTGYYVDPNSGSKLFDLNVEGTGNKYLQIWSTTANEAMVRYIGGSGSGWYVGKRTAAQLVGTGDFHFFAENPGATVAGIDTAGNIFASGSVRAPIFYDSQDTSYYVDPHQTSRLFNLTVVNTAVFAGGSFVANNGDFYARRSGGSDGVYYFVDGGNKYLYWDGSRYLFGSAGPVDAAVSYRAPIYYDSDNTAYYLDPASTGTALSTNGILIAGTGTSGGVQNRTFAGGRNRIWSFANADTYGLSYFQGGPDYIGLHFGTATQAASQFWVSDGGNAQASVSLRAPIFYDSNNTAYYVDPAGSTSARFAGTGIFGLGVDGDGIYINHDQVWTPAGNLHLQFSGGGNIDMCFGGGFAFSRTSLRAPIFSDYNDTAYYLDPNTTSNDALRIRGGATFGPNVNWGAFLRVGSNGWVGDYASVAVTNGNLHIDAQPGYDLYLNWYVARPVWSEGGAYFPIYYDRNNSAFYVDPASGSRLGGQVTFNGGTNIASNGDVYARRDSGATGVYYFATGSDRYLYFDGATYLFGGSYGVSANRFVTGGDMRAPIFYDIDNTGFYVDGAGTSVLNTVNLSRINMANSNSVYADGDGNAGWRFGGTGYVYFNQASPSYFEASVVARSGVRNDSAGLLTLLGGTSGGTQINTDTRSPIYYDSNNTAYYVDPTNITQLISLTASDIISNIDIRTPIFRDLNNTSFYVDPAGFSFLGSVSLGAQTWRSDITWNGGVNVNVNSESSFDVYSGGTCQIWDTTSGAPFIQCTAGNQVQIGQAGSRGLYVFGAITASGNVTAFSDIRVKDNVEQIGGALDRLQAIRGVTYTRNDLEDKERRYAGVIAQEIEAVLPEAVFDSEGKKSVDYNATIGLLIEAIKELTARVAELEGK